MEAAPNLEEARSGIERRQKKLVMRELQLRLVGLIVFVSVLGLIIFWAMLLLFLFLITDPFSTHFGRKKPSALPVKIS